MTKPTAGARFAKFWRTGHRQARIDIREQWGRAAACLFFAGLCTCLGLLYPFSQASGRDGSACLPDGSFEIQPQSFRYWSRSGFFQITVGFGKLSFTTAKLIDVIWDVGFGRGGQALLALISWNIFVQYITTVMETRPVTYRTYRTIFWQDQTILAIPRMIRDFSTRLSLQSKVAMTFIISTMMFVWSFPILGSSMTGYSANVQAFVDATDGNLVPFSSFELQTVYYVIHDGERINKTDDFAIIVSLGGNGDPVLTPLDNLGSEWGPFCNLNNGGWCVMYHDVSSYFTRYRDRAASNESTVYNNITLNPPPLNITKLADISDSPNVSGNEINVIWLQSNKPYNADYITRHGSCQTLNTYQWGFSFIQLNIMIILLIIWTVGMYIMWLYSHVTMKRRGREQVTGEYKAIVELANSMKKQLDSGDSQHVNDITHATESELRRRIVKDLQGGAISYNTELLSNQEEQGGALGWRAVKAYLKKEKFWLFALVAFGGASIALGVLDLLPFVICTVGLTLAIIITLCVGSNRSSRIIIFFWCFWVLVVVPEVAAVLGILQTKNTMGPRFQLDY